MEISEVLNYLNTNSGAFTVLFTAIVTISTVAYAVLTWILVSETKRMRQVQTEPKIEVTIKSFDFAVHIVRIHVRNIGLGPAMNVRFTPRVLSGGEAAQALLEEFTKTNFFKIGLKYFGPGQERYSHYTQMTEGHDGKIESVLAIDLAYESTTGVKYKEQATIDMSELKGEYQLGTPLGKLGSEAGVRSCINTSPSAILLPWHVLYDSNWQALFTTSPHGVTAGRIFTCRTLTGKPGWPYWGKSACALTGCAAPGVR